MNIAIVDHLVYATPDLALGIEQVADSLAYGRRLAVSTLAAERGMRWSRWGREVTLKSSDLTPSSRPRRHLDGSRSMSCSDLAS
jgi:hypothetical protein